MPPAPAFDEGFREGLRALLTWRRDVRRFRRDPLPPGAVERLIELAALAPSVGLSQPWRFVVVDDAACRGAVRRNFASRQRRRARRSGSGRAAQYARLKLAGLDEAPCHLAVFADRATAQGHGLGRHTMPEMVDYSAVAAVHTLWLAARAEGIGMGWVSILDPREIASDPRCSGGVEADRLFLSRLSGRGGGRAAARNRGVGSAARRRRRS